MRRAVEHFKKTNKKATFVLQLTAMVDMFTILIVFLLKSYSTSAVHITPQKGMKLPYSTSYEQPVEALRLIVSKKGIFVEDKQVVEFDESGRLSQDEVDPSDADFIRGLYKELDRQALKSKDVAKENEDIEFEGKIVMQADAELPYGLLKKVMYTTSLAGYADLKLATMSFE